MDLQDLFAEQTKAEEMKHEVGVSWDWWDAENQNATFALADMPAK